MNEFLITKKQQSLFTSCPYTGDEYYLESLSSCSDYFTNNFTLLNSSSQIKMKIRFNDKNSAYKFAIKNDLNVIFCEERDNNNLIKPKSYKDRFKYSL